ncbi:MAG: hydrogenase formation protein HypD [Candidatus Aminicenantes bacterium]|nr:hydrogenase formation protein HypD [Candidatus Aminicenantes bacterium]
MKNELLKEFAEKLRHIELEEPVNIMEVCGTHTVQFFHTGVKDIFPGNLNLIDGPGCPVCVTTNDYLDRAIEIAKKHDVILSTFGDMMRVPSSYSSLQKEKAGGLDVAIVYSPLDALEIAAKNPGREVVFLSVGFETTVPTEAVCVKKAKEENIKNFSILPGNKLTPPAVAALLESGEVNLDGFILPGHVSAITGVKGWRFVAEKYKKPCVIAGFNSKDLLLSTIALVNLIKKGKTGIINEYKEVVKEEGNIKAQGVMAEVFAPADAEWRGIGVIPGSGLLLREDYAGFDAGKKFPVTPPPVKEAIGCRCGEILRGLISPLECPLFGKECTPASPVGACMVSTEGSCAAYYKYTI